MRVVSFVTQKGGSGKSTTAASIAVAAFQQGRRVFMLELDRQGTLSDWADTRQAEEGPEFERIDATALDKALATLREANYDLAVVDTPGVDSPATVAAMRAARPVPRPLQTDGDRSARMPADGPKPHPAGEALCLRSQPMPSPLCPGRGDARGPRSPRPDRGAADRQPGGPSGCDGGRAGSDRVQ